MKVKKLIKKMNAACIAHDVIQERKFWLKILKKSLKHKKTGKAM
jgi:hypothetical protein